MCPVITWYDQSAGTGATRTPCSDTRCSKVKMNILWLLRVLNFACIRRSVLPNITVDDDEVIEDRPQGGGEVISYCISSSVTREFLLTISM